MSTLRRLWAMVRFFRRVGGVEGMKAIAKNAPKYAHLCKRLLADKRVPASAKAVLMGAGAFAISPLNLPGRADQAASPGRGWPDHR